MERWRVLLSVFADDVARHPGFWSLIAYAAALVGIETLREHRRIAAMLADLERDMTTRADEIAARMAIAKAEEFDA